MHKFGVGTGRPSLDPMERRRQRSVIRRKAINFTKIVSLVGIRHATDSQNSIVRRVVWVLWLLFGTGFALGQIIERTNDYAKYLLRTEVQFVTAAETLRFPQVTLCNDNPVPKVEGEVEKTLKDIDEEYKSMKNQEKGQSLDEKKRNESVARLRGHLERLHSITGNWTELSRNFSLTVDEAVLEARFKNEKVKAVEVITDQGHCYAFSTEESPLYSNKGGLSDGLYFILNVGNGDPEKYLGYKMLIHDSHELPRMKEASTVIELKAQTQTRVAISYENILYEGPPYFQCNTTDENYRLSNCLSDCDDKVFKKRCRCTDIYMKPDSQLPGCSYGQILRCKTFFLDVDVSSVGLEACDCPRECNTSTYKTSVTQVPTALIPGSARKVYVSVFYPNIAYVEANNVAAYDFLELLGDIGGALSLLLGATILTVYEVCEFIALVVKDYVSFKLFK